LQTRISSVEHSRLEYDSSRKELASAREAVLKHARKTDGKSDPGLESQEAQAETILASEAYFLCMSSLLETVSETLNPTNTQPSFREPSPRHLLPCVRVAACAAA